MMFRTLLAMGAIAIGVTAAIAQQDIISERQKLMKANGANGAIVTRMVRGTDPFDAAKVQAAFAQWAETAAKFPALFPDNARTGDTRALPAVWEKKAEFNAAAAKLAKDVADTREKAVASLDGLKAAMPIVGKNCNDCHETFRRPQ